MKKLNKPSVAAMYKSSSWRKQGYELKVSLRYVVSSVEKRGEQALGKRGGEGEEKVNEKGREGKGRGEEERRGEGRDEFECMIPSHRNQNITSCSRARFTITKPDLQQLV